MSRYLIDTNICIAFFRGSALVAAQLERLESGSLFISEITLAELRYGAYKSPRPGYHLRLIQDLLDEVEIVPITNSIDMFAMEKARLSEAGVPIDNFDLLIGATAIHHGLVLVTNNTRHFERLQGIALEDWTA